MDQDNLPPGFRFHPTDEELITYYLNHKISDFGFSPKAIADVDLNKCEPWDLPDKAKMGEKEWYFFNLRDRKYPTGLRTNRATESGYWKTTGKDKEIFHCGAQVGMKKTLVFYKGRAPRGEKTNWVMHEYRHQTKSAYRPTKEEWVVCRVFRKSSINKKPMTMSSQSLSSLLDSPCNTTSAADLADMDMSAFNNMLTPPPNTTNNTINDFSNYVVNNKLDLNMYMNWVLNRDVSNQHPFVSWSNGMPNLPTSSSILRGLQLSGCPQMEGVDTTACPSSSNVADINNPSIWRNY